MGQTGKRHTMSITSAVKDILMKNPPVCECMRIINYSKLASHIMKDVEKKTGKYASIEAIKTAIRRFVDSEKNTNQYDSVRSVLSGGRLNLRNNVAVLAIYPSMRSIENIGELEKKIDRTRGEILHIVAGINCIVIILDESNYKRAESTMRKDLLSERTGLSAITITTSLSITNTPGVIAYITALIARNGLNIEEISSCYTDTAIIMEKNDAMTAYALLESATNEKTTMLEDKKKKRFRPVMPVHSVKS